MTAGIWIALITTAGGIIGIAIQKWRRDTPADKADTITRLMTAVDTAVARADDATKAAQAARRQAEENATKLVTLTIALARAEETVLILKHVIVRHVAPIIIWLDQGASPPPPQVAQELRDLIADIDNT